MNILITRPLEDGVRTCERLATIGHNAVLIPIARIEEVGADKRVRLDDEWIPPCVRAGCTRPRRS